jgi:filamentous hemagglutinin family protein
MRRNRFSIALTSLVLTSFTPAAIAQVSPILPPIVADTTLRSQVTSPDLTNFRITGGTQVGGNLFHSFQQFSVPTAGSAIFANGLDVQTILARVTGGTLSNIDGVIQASGNSNLFLLNPAGIIFGPGAKLNIGGSFLGTTANTLQFADGTAFSATDRSTTPPLLTVSVPIGLQFGATSGAIQVQGAGHSRILDGKTQSTDRTPLVVSNSDLGVTIGANQTLALVGNGVNLAGGILNIPQGNLELGSVQSGVVGLAAAPSGWRLNYGAVQQFGDIQLSQKAIVNGSGLGGSQIHLAGRNVTLKEAAIVLMQNQGTTDSGVIQVDATDTLRIMDMDANNKIQSGIHRQQLSSGQGGATIVNARNVELLSGGAIVAKTFSTANNGDVTINAANGISVLGYAPNNRVVSSEIVSYTLNRGESGNLSLAAQNFSVLEGGLVGIGTFSSGSANDLRVRVRELVNVSGEEPVKGQFSSLFALSFGPGLAGNIDLVAQNMLIEGGGRIGVSAFANGNAGRLVADVAQTITVSGRSAKTNQPSFLSSAGNILPPSLRLIYGTPDFPTANAGSVTLNTDRLIVNNGALVTVRNLGLGDAGKLMVNANRIDLTQGGGIAASTQAGNGGNLEINARDLIFMRDRGAITAQAKGTGNGGNLFLQSPLIVGIDNSDIIAKAEQGNGGNIEIITNTVLGLVRRPILTPESDITATSDFGISGQITINGPEVALNENVIPLPTSLLDASQAITERCDDNQMSKFVITGRGGLPVDPEHNLTQQPWSDRRSIVAPSVPTVSAKAVSVRPLQEAIGLKQRSDGQIELTAGPVSVQNRGVTCALSPLLTKVQ